MSSFKKKDEGRGAHAFVNFLMILAYQVGLFTGMCLGLAMLFIGYGVERRDNGALAFSVVFIVLAIVGTTWLWRREVTPRRDRVARLVGKAWTLEREDTMVREPSKEETRSRDSERDDLPRALEEEIAT